MNAQSLRRRFFVEVSELNDLLGTPKRPVILDVRTENGVADGRAEYEGGHIPGAVYVDLAKELVGPSYEGSGAGPLPGIAELQASARRWGISKGDAVVVYDNVAGTKAGRGWLVLRWAGVEDVRILDGGYASWVAAGYRTETKPPSPKLGDVNLTPDHLAVIDTDAAAKLGEDGVLLDARDAETFRGSDANGKRSGGHIPGAISAPTRENLDARGLLLEEDELRGRFAALGADGSRAIAVYCGSGVSAAHEMAILSSLGLEVSIYVGSFSAWSAAPSRPVAFGSR